MKIKREFLIVKWKKAQLYPSVTECMYPYKINIHTHFSLDKRPEAALIEVGSMLELFQHLLSAKLIPSLHFRLLSHTYLIPLRNHFHVVDVGWRRVSDDEPRVAPLRFRPYRSVPWGSRQMERSNKRFILITKETRPARLLWPITAQFK
ncbi:hypothetical protein KQX54_008362 [Cotesia glomerata]|uniref:Uncharacterized protein n=1 Tax=Cotesia glomerata TaxID=32391 RepID=A0AAV7HI32_COTGL|nr:hypothetical protein KQX54_008362 [Cotesia glomerata]